MLLMYRPPLAGNPATLYSLLLTLYSLLLAATYFGPNRYTAPIEIAKYSRSSLPKVFERDVRLQPNRELAALIEVDAATRRAIRCDVVAIQSEVSHLSCLLLRRARTHRASAGIVIHGVVEIPIRPRRPARESQRPHTGSSVREPARRH